MNEIITKLNNLNVSSNNSYNFIELCAGAGGFSKGFINKNFNPLLLNDNDKKCCETLKKNHPNVNIICKNMEELDLIIYKNIDLMISGCPCQSYSMAGKRLGFEDKRGNLLLIFLKNIENINPKTFVIENVKGLLNHNSGKSFKYILEEINKIGKYNVYWELLNSNDYDVPQKRERLFIVGVIKSIKKEYKFPEKEKYKPVLKDVLMNINYGKVSEGYLYPEHKRKVMELVPEGGCWIDLPENIQKEYMKKSYFSSGGKRGIARRLSMDKPSLTLTTSPCQKQTERCHPIETRPLNLKEYARIQTFPDDYYFCGSISQKYKQIGNAVPINLAQRIAESIKNVLDSVED